MNTTISEFFESLDFHRKVGEYLSKCHESKSVTMLRNRKIALNERLQQEQQPVSLYDLPDSEINKLFSLGIEKAEEYLQNQNKYSEDDIREIICELRL